MMQDRPWEMRYIWQTLLTIREFEPCTYADAVFCIEDSDADTILRCIDTLEELELVSVDATSQATGLKHITLTEDGYKAAEFVDWMDDRQKGVRE